MYDMIYLTAIG